MLGFDIAQVLGKLGKLPPLAGAVSGANARLSLLRG